MLSMTTNHMELEEVEINGLPLISCDVATAAQYILNHLGNGRSQIFSHINIYNYYLLHSQPATLNELKRHSLFFLDGIALKIGTFFLSRGWENDLSGTDVFPVLANLLSNSDYKLFLLGSEENVIKQARSNMLANYPGLDIAGYGNGYFAIGDESEIVEIINNSAADIVLIGMGMAKEAEFIIRNFDKLPNKVIWNVGGLFDFISGNKPRAPRWMRKLRLEWLFRFLIEPKRMLFRYMILPFWYFAHLILLRIKSK